MKTKTLPSAITSYDLLKTFAVIVMIYDHIFYYNLVESEALLFIKNITTSAPLWFFFIGHARGRHITRNLLLGALILIITDMLVGHRLLPVNNLVTIILIRLSIEPIMKACLRNHFQFVIVLGLLILAMPFTMVLVEYGTMGVIAAMYGYMVRNKEEVGGSRAVIAFMFCSWFCFILCYALSTQSALEIALVSICVFALNLLLYRFESKEYPELTNVIPSTVTFFIQLFGRKTLLVYVYHLVLFKVFALMVGSMDFEPLSFTLVRWE